MPRKPRLHDPGAVYHVILRGNAKQDVFFDCEDRRRFLSFLTHCIDRFEIRVHGYCLMTNHVHLAIQVGEVPLSRIMQSLCLRYTKWVNWRQNRIGHLFHGRYKAVMVDADNYLLQLVSYLHLNPIRARMTDTPQEYQWSSHRAYQGIEPVPWLTTDFVLSQFSGNKSKAREAFSKFVDGCLTEGHRTEFHGSVSDSRLLGEDTFIQDVLNKESAALIAPTMEEILEEVQKICEVSSEELFASGQGARVSEARALAAWGVRSFSNATLTELGKILNRDTSTLSSAARRLEARSQHDEGLSVKMDAVRSVRRRFATLQS